MAEVASKVSPFTGYGIDQLRESNLSTYLQSDDATPHYINIQFKRKMLVADICLYMDYKNDESYTPNKWVGYHLVTIQDDAAGC